MKKITTVMVAIPILFATSPVVTLAASDLALTSCMDGDTCSRMTTTLSPCCCKTGKTGYECPSGWTELDGTCTRKSVTASDNTGYYTQDYGTCAGTPITCYKVSSSTDRNPDGSMCLCNKSTGTGVLP